MKRLIITGPNESKIIEDELPKLRPFDVVIKVRNACICGTDFEIASGESSFVKSGLIKYPVPAGHEWSGEIAFFGEDSKDKGFSVGDRVISDTWTTCGECEFCKKGEYSRCPDIRSIGTINAYPGAFAEYMVLPYWNLHKLPDKVSFAEAAVIEPTSIAHHAIYRSSVFSDAEFRRNCTALVIGTGGIGIAAASLLKNCYDIKKVIVAGRKDEKLNVALSAGADTVINTTREDLAARCKEETSGKGVNLIIETSGSVDMLNRSLDALSVFGEVASLAFYSRTLDGFDIDTLVNNCGKLIGVGGQYGVNMIIDFINQGKLTLMPLITHRIKFDDLPDVFNHPEKYKSSKIKILVDF